MLLSIAKMQKKSYFSRRKRCYHIQKAQSQSLRDRQQKSSATKALSARRRKAPMRYRLSRVERPPRRMHESTLYDCGRCQEAGKRRESTSRRFQRQKTREEATSGKTSEDAGEESYDTHCPYRLRPARRAGGRKSDVAAGARIPSRWRRECGAGPPREGGGCRCAASLVGETPSKVGKLISTR